VIAQDRRRDGRVRAAKTIRHRKDLAAGCAPFLHADDPGSLAGPIRAQDARCRQPAGT
jgi:hypothetical protein